MEFRNGELLVNDGLCSFGFGGHNSNNEIMVGKYNLISIYENEKRKIQIRCQEKNENSIIKR